jgi:serine/threonine protein kinase
MEYGRYRILNQLGQGGMATVYLAEDPLLQRLVAIKVIQAHLSSNSGLMDRFTVEAKTIASLRHVNIVEVFDFGIQDDQQFLVMEYIDGQNLQAICAALLGRPMSNTVAACIICQAAEGLTSAEKHGVVHRDIKPENLMFNSEGQLKIADFGIAHIADEGSRTQTGAVLGSPNFMSPEQIEGVKPTNKTDIFSLGGVFYYCLTAKMPFTGPSIPVTMRNICERPHPSVVELNPGADPILVRLIDTLLQKAPEHRGDGARWLANQLRAYLNSHGIVDIVDHVKTFVNSLGIVGGGQTIAEGGPGTKQTLRSSGRGGSSIGGFPSSAVIRTGSTMSGGNSTMSRSMANPADFQTQATTGAMGPSSRSPVVWIGALLSLCVLVLAGSIIWTRLDKGDPVKPVAVKTPPVKPPVTRPQNVQPDPVPQSGSNGLPNNTQQANQAALAAQYAAEQAAMAERNRLLERERERDRAAALQRERESRERENRERERRHNGANNPQNTPKDPVESAQTGFVLIKSAPPFAALTINGKPQGETPMNAYLEVPIGKCHVEIVHRLSPPFDTVITVTPGFRREFKFKLDR